MASAQCGCSWNDAGNTVDQCFPFNTPVATIEAACTKAFGSTMSYASLIPSKGCTTPGMLGLECLSSSGCSVADACAQTCKSAADNCPQSAACFDYWANLSGDNLGKGAAFDAIIDPGDGSACGFHPITGDPIPSCPLMTALPTDERNSCGSDGKSACPNAITANAWCDCNPELCNQAMRAFCVAGNSSGFYKMVDGKKTAVTADQIVACACFNPEAHPWGTLTWGDLTSITAFKGSTFPLQCVWPPCRDASGSVLTLRETDKISCPTIKDLCLNIIQDVHLENVKANSITLGECIQSAGGNLNGGNTTFAQGMKQWFEENPAVWISMLVVFLLIVFGVVALWVSKSVSPLAKAKNRMAFEREQQRRTREANLLAAAYTSSGNKDVELEGQVIQRQREKEIAEVKTAATARKGKVNAKIAKLGDDKNSARQRARLTVGETLAEEQDKRLIGVFSDGL